MINIIMPAYNGHETIKQAIASVVMQDDSDKITLTIVDDLSDKPFDYLRDDFKYLNINILRKPTNTGCGPSRQYGIDRCSEKYFMFLDVDDCLSSPSSVKNMLSCMERNCLDSLWTNYVEELSSGEIIVHKNSGVHMHGKMYRTEYIRSNNIRFNMTRLHEDHAFNTIALLTGGKNMYVNSTTYIWRFCKQSLTRSQNAIEDIRKSMSEYLTNAEYTLSELMKRDIENKLILDIVIKYVFSFYKYYNVIKLSETDSKYIDHFINNVKSIMLKLPAVFIDSLDYNTLEDMYYQNESIISMSKCGIVACVTFADYLVMIL